MQTSNSYAPLQEQEGATLLVSAKFSVISVRNIYLQFEEVSLQFSTLLSSITSIKVKACEL